MKVYILYLYKNISGNNFSKTEKYFITKPPKNLAVILAGFWCSNQKIQRYNGHCLRFKTFQHLNGHCLQS